MILDPGDKASRCQHGDEATASRRQGKTAEFVQHFLSVGYGGKQVAPVDALRDECYNPPRSRIPLLLVSRRSQPDSPGSICLL